MKLSSSTDNDALVVSVNETRIDAAVSVHFKDAMRAQTENGPYRVILDLTLVDFIDSSGLGAIVAVMKQLGRERRLDLAGLSANVDKVFRLTRMDSVFYVFETLQHALDSDQLT